MRREDNQVRAEFLGVVHDGFGHVPLLRRVNMDLHDLALENGPPRDLIKIRLGLIPVREVRLTVDSVGGAFFDDVEQFNPRAERFGHCDCCRQHRFRQGGTIQRNQDHLDHEP
jgi:hypothetical protein